MIKKISDLPYGKRLDLYYKCCKLWLKLGKLTLVSKKLKIPINTVISWIQKGSAPRPPKYIPDLSPSKELSYLAGAMWSDGDRSGLKRHEIRLPAKDKEFVKKFDKCLIKVLRKRKLFPIHVSDRRKEGKGIMYYVSADSKMLAEWLWRYNTKSFKECIEKYPADFIRAFANGDGNIDDEANLIRIGKGKNPQTYHLLSYIKKLLSKYFGITSKIKEESKSYRLYIYGEGNIVKWTKIGFTIKEKREKLIERCKSIKHKLYEKEIQRYQKKWS